MTIIKIESFDGEAPRIAPRQLPDTMAQSAINCKLWSTLEPFRAPSVVLAPTKPVSEQSMFRLGQGLAETQYWLTWGTDVDVARGQIANDTTERIYYTGDGVPKVTDITMAVSGGGTNYPNNSYTLGVPKPVNAPTLVVSGTGTGLPEARLYVITNVTGWGEESAPSAVSASVNVQVGQTVALSAMPTVPSGAYNVVAKRIYRSNTSTLGAQFQFVAEIIIAATTYNDSLPGTSLGELLATDGWVPPPADLKGIIALPNGVMAGFTGSDVCFSEPYAPYAWPIKYRQTCDFPIISIGYYGGMLVVGTTGIPYQITGIEPGGMTMAQMDVRQSCVSKRSMVHVGSGVCYASPDGLILASNGTAIIATRDNFTRDEWQALNPSSIHGYSHDGRYYGFYNNGVTSGAIIFSPSDGRDGLIRTDVAATCCYVDPVLDALYMRIGSNIKRWDADIAANLTFTWKSKIWVMPKPKNMGCAQLYAASYPVQLEIYADGLLKYVKSVQDDKPFRLPSGYLAKEYEVKIISDREVYAVYVAESIAELSNV